MTKLTYQCLKKRFKTTTASGTLESNVNLNGYVVLNDNNSNYNSNQILLIIKAAKSTTCY